MIFELPLASQLPLRDTLPAGKLHWQRVGVEPAQDSGLEEFFQGMWGVRKPRAPGFVAGVVFLS